MLDNARHQASETWGIAAMQKAFGVTARTLRFYEQKELLEPVRETPAGRRLYDAGQRKRMGSIRCATRLGFTLDEIHAHLDRERNLVVIPSAVMSARINQLAEEAREAKQRYQEAFRFADGGQPMIEVAG